MLRDRELQLTEFTASYPDEIKSTREKNRAPIFDLDSDTNYEVDSRLIDDIQEERDV